MNCIICNGSYCFKPPDCEFFVCLEHFQYLASNRDGNVTLLKRGVRDFAIVPGWTSWEGCGWRYSDAEEVARLHGVKREDCTVLCGHTDHVENQELVKLRVI